MTKKPSPPLRRRIILGATAVALIIALMVSGTLAWNSISQSALNTLSGEPLPAGGRLHDDFEQINDATTGVNKDVYVENYGDRPIFVRVKLYEYMEIGVGANLSPDDSGYADRTAQTLVDGNLADRADTDVSRDDVSTWTPHIPKYNDATDSLDGFHYYWNWTMGGSKTFLPTFNMDTTSTLTDLTGVATDESDNMNTAPGDGTHDYFVNNPAPVTDTATFFNKDTQTVEQQEEAHTPTSTLNGTVMSLEQWQQAGSKPGPYWVYDADGWAYWAKALLPQDATGLLLNSVTLQNEPDDAWYYGIYVKVQMATAGDWGQPEDIDAGTPATGFYSDGERFAKDGLFILNQAAGRLPTVTSVDFADVRAFVKAGESITLQPIVTVQHSADPLDKSVTWKISPATSSFNNGVLTPMPNEAGKVYTVTATSRLDPNFSATITVTVYPPSGLGVIKGDDGRYYFVEFDDNCFQVVNDDGSLGPVLCAGLDERPGSIDDKTNVVTASDGTRYLGPFNDGGSDYFWAYGADGKLGTEDDVKMWMDPSYSPMTIDHMTTKDPDNKPVDNIIITQKAATGNGVNTANAGATITYSAQTLTSGLPALDQGVTWYITTPGGSANTKLAPTGVNNNTSALTTGSVDLVIDPSDTRTSITLRAIANADNTVYKDVTVTVRSLAVRVETTRKITAAAAGDNADWIEIASYGGYSLIYRVNVLPTTVSNPPITYTNSPQQTAVNNWFNGNTTLAAGARLRSFTVSNNAMSQLGATWNHTVGFSTPTGTVPASGANTAFLLSQGESYAYCSMCSESPGSAGLTVSPAQAQTNLKALTRNNAVDELGRTSGVSMADGPDMALLATVSSGSKNWTNGAGTMPTRGGVGYLRPALWVKSDQSLLSAR